MPNIFLLILLVFSLGCNSKDQNSHVLLVGTNAEFPPFSFRKDDKIVGFDIDIAKEVCLRLGKTPNFIDMPFDALIPDLVLGNIDFIAAGLSGTKERAKRVSFTKPHLTDDPLIILTRVELGTGLTYQLNDFLGKTIVVNEGYTADLLLSDKGGFNLIRLSSPADALLALKNNRSDAFVTAESSIQPFLASESMSQFQYNIINEAADNYALALAKDNVNLLVEIQTALDSMEKDGTLRQIKNKWNLK